MRFHYSTRVLDTPFGFWSSFSSVKEVFCLLDINRCFGGRSFDGSLWCFGRVREQVRDWLRLTVKGEIPAFVIVKGRSLMPLNLKSIKSTIKLLKTLLFGSDCVSNLFQAYLLGLMLGDRKVCVSVRERTCWVKAVAQQQNMSNMLSAQHSPTCCSSSAKCRTALTAEAPTMQHTLTLTSFEVTLFDRLHKWAAERQLRDPSTAGSHRVARFCQLRWNWF